ncbi:MAG: DUF6320 domain-containing protein [Raoultibacter sp.]|jgi:hypothetical protein
MKRCEKCGIGLTGELENCPLCQNELIGKSEASVFPQNATKKSSSLALKVLAFITGVCLILMFPAWQVLSLPGNIVLTICLGLILNYLFIRNILTHNPDFLRVVVRYFLILLAIAAIWFLLTWDLTVTTFVIPSICLLAIIFDTVILAVFRSTFIAGYAKYLLFHVFLGLTPLALIALGLTSWDILAYTSAFTASVFFLWLLVFMRKQLLAEIRKLFSS